MKKVVLRAGLCTRWALIMILPTPRNHQHHHHHHHHHRMFGSTDPIIEVIMARRAVTHRPYQFIIIIIIKLHKWEWQGHCTAKVSSRRLSLLTKQCNCTPLQQHHYVDIIIIIIIVVFVIFDGHQLLGALGPSWSEDGGRKHGTAGEHCSSALQ